jgi:hypothetical protein
MTQKPPFDWNTLDRLVPHVGRLRQTQGKPVDRPGHGAAMRRRTHDIVENWCTSYEGEQNAFGSVAIFAETKIRESLSVLATSTSSTSSSIRIALCLDALWRVGGVVFNRYEPLFRLIMEQILVAVYIDYPKRQPDAFFGESSHSSHQ